MSKLLSLRCFFVGRLSFVSTASLGSMWFIVLDMYSVTRRDGGRHRFADDAAELRW